MSKTIPIVLLVVGGLIAVGCIVGLIVLLNSGGETPQPPTPRPTPQPDDFMWGSATASYQIEGGWDVDGKGRSIWDEFAQAGGRVKNNDTGNIACLSYYKYKEDVQLLKQMSLTHYRFSVSWPRVLPQGTRAGGVNEAGIQYYSNLIDELLANDIQPAVTLYHWDLPLALNRSYGGWLDRRIVQDFVDYADLLFERLGDRVKTWITINEPNIFSDLGYGRGYHAPGVNDPKRGPYIAGHYLLLAHAEAYHLYSRKYRAQQQGTVSITMDAAGLWPKNESSSSDGRAAERGMLFVLGRFADPVYFGDYPQLVKDRVAQRSIEEGLPESRLPSFTEEEKTRLRGTSDFFGLNLYTGHLVEEDASPEADDSGTKREQPDDWPRSGSDWLRVIPAALPRVLNWIRLRYDNPPVVVTENGLSDNSGQVNDPHRSNFYDQYINGALEAKRTQNCNLIGYFAWSLLDNFEWAEGYTEKFGLTRIDYDSPERTRTPKDSSRWYGSFVRRQRGLA